MPNDETTIAELFARDPFTLATTDIDAIIEYYVSRRNDFVQNKRAAPRLDKPKPSLDDLGL